MMTGDVHIMVGKTLRSRAMMANALCAMAEDEVRSNRLLKAAETVQSVRGVLDDIAILLSGDTSYLPPTALREVAELLAGLDERIIAIEKDLKPRLVN